MAYYFCYLKNSTATVNTDSNKIIGELETLTENERYSIWSKQTLKNFNTLQETINRA